MILIPIIFGSLIYLAIAIAFFIFGENGIKELPRAGAIVALLSPVWPLILVGTVLLGLVLIPGEVKRLIKIARSGKPNVS
jgi:hypothetical protein